MANPAFDRLKGIGLMIMAVGMFVAMDSIAKILADTQPIPQLVWARYGFHLLWMLPLIPVFGLRRMVTTRVPVRQLARSALLITSTAFAYMAVHRLPLTQVYAVNFTAPLMVTIMSGPLLGEAIGRRRWFAVLLGLSGALIAVRPDPTNLDPGIVFAFTMALSFAVYQILTRQIAPYDGPLVGLFYSALFGFALSSLVVPFYWVPVDARTWVMMAMLGLFGALGHLALITALRLAPASLISPFTYTQLLWATAVGFIIFGHLPDQLTLIGAAIVVAAGLYLAFGERLRLRRR
ncbi:hypothetical protein GCM10011505_30160 [Tistrella bauzanensis]|uniref:EamA domain-containing protein n=2 Tax=Tistrella bauzanensis TaxID=657419 RepID=A0ABQ1INU2_9PROT|nr:hypothetical protein GCM10011505_30160 [Tistrella bauzanensis]